MKIGVVIPNYNGEHILTKNLPKVLEAVSGVERIDAEIIIPDDNSTDNSIQVINKFIGENKNSKVKIKLLTVNKNKGFSSNVNYGVDNSNGDVLILLNSDVIPSKSFLKPLLKHFEDENIFAVGCMDESIENGKTILRGRGIGRWSRGFLVHRAGEVNKNKTLWVSGGSGAFKKNIWEKLGGLDEIYDPFYWEDIDLSYRAQKSGYITLFDKESVVVHEHETGAIKTKHKPEGIKKIAYRNQFIFTWKNSDFSTLISHIFWLPYHLAKAVFSGDLPFILGLLLALKKLRTVINSRRQARKLFVKTDKEVTTFN